MEMKDEIPKYLKKKKRLCPKKSQHKHTYSDCVLKYKEQVLGREIEFQNHANYCTICGKIGNVVFLDGYEVDSHLNLTQEGAEKKAYWDTVPFFHVRSPFDKWINMNK